MATSLVCRFVDRVGRICALIGARRVGGCRRTCAPRTRCALIDQSRVPLRDLVAGCHHDDVILAIWPSLMNPAVRLVMFGIGFMLAGLGVLAMQWKDRQTWWQRSAAYRTSMAKIGSV